MFLVILKQAAEAIANLYTKLERNEPDSHSIFFDYSKVFARVCGKSSVVLKETERYLERAILLDQSNVDYLNELGSQKLGQHKIKDAQKCFANTLKRDEQNIAALLGKLKCQIVEERQQLLQQKSEQQQNQLDDVGQQFELLAEAIPTILTNPEFPYLKAIFNKMRNMSDKNVKLIDESITCHFKALKGLPLGKSYFYNLNPDFVLELVKEYMAYAPSTVRPFLFIT